MICAKKYENARDPKMCIFYNIKEDYVYFTPCCMQTISHKTIKIEYVC